MSLILTPYAVWCLHFPKHNSYLPTLFLVLIPVPAQLAFHQLLMPLKRTWEQGWFLPKFLKFPEFPKFYDYRSLGTYRKQVIVLTMSIQEINKSLVLINLVGSQHKTQWHKQDTKFRGWLDYLAVHPSPDVTMPHQYCKPSSSAICFGNSCGSFGNRGRAMVSSSSVVVIVWRLFCFTCPVPSTACLCGPMTSANSHI